MLPVRILLSLAFGLVGLDGVAAGPCKPKPPASSSSSSTITSFTTSSTTTQTTLTSTTLFTPVSSTPSSSSPTTTASSTSSSSSTSTSSSTPLSTTSVAPTTTTTTTSSTSSVTTTSTTSTAPAPSFPANFNIVAGSGAIPGQKLQARPNVGSYAPFNTDYIPTAVLHYEPNTGYLRVGDTTNVYLCVIYSLDPTVADFATCNGPDSRYRMATCQPSAQNILTCSAPACSYTSQFVPGDPNSDNPDGYYEYTLGCDPAAAPWTKFFTRKYTGDPGQVSLLSLGPETPIGTDTTLQPAVLNVVAV